METDLKETNDVKVKVDIESGWVDIRKYYVNANGDEMPTKKGIRLYANQMHRLSELVVNSGFGDTDKLKKYLEEREVFVEEKDDKYIDEETIDPEKIKI